MYERLVAEEGKPMPQEFGHAPLIAGSHLCFIGGAARSGTTLVQAIFSSARDSVPLLGEIQHLKHLLDVHRTVKTAWDDDTRYFFNDRREATSEISGIISTHLGRVCDLYRAQRVAVKAPELTEYAVELDELFPDSIRCVVHRSALDVVASQYVATRKEISLGYAPSMAGKIANDDDLVLQLAIGVLKSYSLFPRTSWVAIQYEELVSSPDVVIRSIKEQTNWNINWSSGATWPQAPFTYLRDSHTFQLAWTSDLWGKPFTDERIGMYKSILSGRQADIVREVCHTGTEGRN